MRATRCAALRGTGRAVGAARLPLRLLCGGRSPVRSAAVELPLLGRCTPCSSRASPSIHHHPTLPYPTLTTPTHPHTAPRQDNDIILCDGMCNRAYHVRCLVPPVDPEALPEDEGWLCPACDRKVRRGAVMRCGKKKEPLPLPLPCTAPLPRTHAHSPPSHTPPHPCTDTLTTLPHPHCPPPAQMDMIDLINDEFGTLYDDDTPWQQILAPETLPHSPPAAAAAAAGAPSERSTCC